MALAGEMLTEVGVGHAEFQEFVSRVIEFDAEVVGRIGLKVGIMRDAGFPGARAARPVEQQTQQGGARFQPAISLFRGPPE